MQLFGARKTEDPADFWRSTAEKRGGTVGFFTYASLLGRSGGNVLDLPGLLYTVGATVWFEDFERDNWVAKMMGGSKSYVKTELSFGISDVAFARIVTRSRALACISGRVAAADLPAAGALGRLFSAPFVAVGLRDGAAIFLDAIKREEFVAVLRGAAPAAPAGTSVR